MKSAFIIAIVIVAMIGMITPNVFAIHHQSSDTLPESFTMTEIPNAVSSPSSPAPGFYEISQYAIGTVVFRLFLWKVMDLWILANMIGVNQNENYRSKYQERS